MNRRKTLWLALTMYAGQAMASVMVVVITPHASGGGFTDFRLYFGVGDWLTLRLPLIAAVGAALVVALGRNPIAHPSASIVPALYRLIARTCRGLPVVVGIACGSLTVGVVLWTLVLRFEATERYFSHYADWPLVSVAYALVLAASIGLGSVAFALRRNDALKAGYFTLCFGLLTVFSALSAASYDVVGVTYGWSGLAALIAAGLTLACSDQRGRVILAISLAMLVAAMVFALAFSPWSSAAAVIGLLALQVLTLRSLVETVPLTPDIEPLTSA